MGLLRAAAILAIDNRFRVEMFGNEFRCAKTKVFIPFETQHGRFVIKGKDLFPYLKVSLDVRCLGMKLNHWNRNANS